MHDLLHPLPRRLPALLATRTCAPIPPPAEPASAHGAKALPARRTNGRARLLTATGTLLLLAACGGDVPAGLQADHAPRHVSGVTGAVDPARAAGAKDATAAPGHAGAAAAREPSTMTAAPAEVRLALSRRFDDTPITPVETAGAAAGD